MLKSGFTSLIVFLFISPVQASPTSADFARCTASATLDLDHCIKVNGIGSSDTCWKQSKQHFDACKKNIFWRYSRQYQQEKIKAARERKKRMKQQPSQQKQP